MHGDAFENIGAFDISEGDILKFDIALDRFVQCGLTFHHFRFGLEQVVDAVGAGEESLELVEGFAEAGEWPEKALGHEDEHAIDTDFERAIEGEPAADKEGAGEPGEDSHADERYECGGELDRIFVGLAVIVADAGEALGFTRFGGKRFDGGDSADVGG